MSQTPRNLRMRIERLSPQQRARLAARLGLGGADGNHDNARGTRLVAYWTPRDRDARTPDASELRSFLKDRLPEHMLPTGFVMLGQLPRTPNGKLDVPALPDPEQSVRPLEDSFLAPRSPVEETLARIWAELLGGVKVGVHDNFFEIGGDSILSIQVVARANQAGLRLTADQLFEHQTIAELADVVAAVPDVAAKQGEVTGTVPLTPIQHWFFEQPLPEPHHWHHQLWLEATARVDAELLAEAVRALVQHHDALRLRFRRGATDWRQAHAAGDTPVSVRRLDLSTLRRTEQETALRQAANALAAETDLAGGPLVGVLLAQLGDGRPARALISIHHLVVDPVSWQPLVEDLCTAYAQLLRAEAVRLPRKTTSFRAWSEAVADYAHSDRLSGEAAFWLALPPAASRMPTDEHGTFTESSARTFETTLDADETELLLQRVPGAYHMQLEEVLLTALARILVTWTGEPRVRLGLERHGREPIAEGLELSRTVGWFTSYFPVVLELESGCSSGEALKAIKEQIRRVPARGVGYGVLRYLSPDSNLRERLRALPDPEVIFNYAGRTAPAWPRDAPLQPLGVPTASRGARNRRAHLLEINVFHAGDRLQLAWTYSANLYRTETIERVATSYVEALRELIRHSVSPEAGGYTPADFPEAGLDQSELDRLLGELFS